MVSEHRPRTIPPEISTVSAGNSVSMPFYGPSSALKQYESVCQTALRLCRLYRALELKGGLWQRLLLAFVRRSHACN